jgi:hypothetical protein
VCEACLEDGRLVALKLLTERHPPEGRTVTKAELERHARKFGPALVQETADELGVKVNVDETPTRRRRTKGPTLKERVAAHVAEGRGVELIAELENLSPSRARRIVQEVSG